MPVKSGNVPDGTALGASRFGQTGMSANAVNAVLRKSLGIKPSEAKRADALVLFRASEYDDAFPGNEMEAVMRRQVSEIGVDPSAKGRIIFDVGDLRTAAS